MDMKNCKYYNFYTRLEFCHILMAIILIKSQENHDFQNLYKHWKIEFQKCVQVHKNMTIHYKHILCNFFVILPYGYTRVCNYFLTLHEANRILNKSNYCSTFAHQFNGHDTSNSQIIQRIVFTESQSNQLALKEDSNVRDD